MSLRCQGDVAQSTWRRWLDVAKPTSAGRHLPDVGRATLRRPCCSCCFLFSVYRYYYENDNERDIPTGLEILRARRTSDGKTALHLCALEGNMTLVKLLLE